MKKYISEYLPIVIWLIIVAPIAYWAGATLNQPSYAEAILDQLPNASATDSNVQLRIAQPTKSADGYGDFGALSQNVSLLKRAGFKLSKTHSTRDDIELCEKAHQGVLFFSKDIVLGLQSETVALVLNENCDVVSIGITSRPNA